MDHCVNGRGRKHRIGQTVQHCRNEDGFVRKHGGRYQTDLDALGRTVDDRNVGHFRTGAAGGRYDEQLVHLAQTGHIVIQAVHVVRAVHNGKHLGDINDRAAADRDNAVKLLAAQAVEDRVYHDVGRLAAAELLLKTGVAAEVQRRDCGFVNVFVGQNQVGGTEVYFLRKCRKIAVFRDRRHDLKAFHIVHLLLLVKIKAVILFLCFVRFFFGNSIGSVVSIERLKAARSETGGFTIGLSYLLLRRNLHCSTLFMTRRCITVSCRG